jgi:hypothetical protein
MSVLVMMVKIPNSKSQINSKKQIPKTNIGGMQQFGFLIVYTNYWWLPCCDLFFTA